MLANHYRNWWTLGTFCDPLCCRVFWYPLCRGSRQPHNLFGGWLDGSTGAAWPAWSCYSTKRLSSEARQVTAIRWKALAVSADGAIRLWDLRHDYAEHGVHSEKAQHLFAARPIKKMSCTDDWWLWWSWWQILGLLHATRIVCLPRLKHCLRWTGAACKHWLDVLMAVSSSGICAHSRRYGALFQLDCHALVCGWALTSQCKPWIAPRLRSAKSDLSEVALVTDDSLSLWSCSLKPTAFFSQMSSYQGTNEPTKFIEGADMRWQKMLQVAGYRLLYL